MCVYACEASDDADRFGDSRVKNFKSSIHTRFNFLSGYGGYIRQKHLRSAGNYPLERLSEFRNRKIHKLGILNLESN